MEFFENDESRGSLPNEDSDFDFDYDELADNLDGHERDVLIVAQKKNKFHQISNALFANWSFA